MNNRLPPGFALSEEVRALVDAIPGAALLLGDGDEVLHANPTMRKLLDGDDGGPLSAARVRNLPGARMLPTPYGYSFVTLPCETAGSPSATDLQTQRLASLGFMVAGVCHEVSNPLAAVHSMTQILRSGRGVTAETLEKGLDSIASNIARVLAITKKLGDFSRVTGDALGEVEIDTAMQEAINLLRHSSAGSGVLVAYRGAESVLAPSRQGELQQVFFNLLLNAAQAMQGSGTIDVIAQAAASARGETLRITIRDSGPGIPAEHLTRVFDPFFTTKSPGEGTGLGLSICYEIIHGLGGTIHAANASGGGACLQLELPCRTVPR